MLQRLWMPWVRDCLKMLSPEATFAHYFWPGALGDQPAFDMEVFDEVRINVIRLRNEKNG